jgi:hypothetical protein
MGKICTRCFLALLTLVIVLAPWLPVRVAAGVFLLLCMRHDKTEIREPEHDRVVALMSRFRHALLNDLQLVSGYVQLEKSAEQVLQRVERATERVRRTGLILELRNWGLSSVCYDIWQQAETAGVSLEFRSSGQWYGFEGRWPLWEEGLLAVWTYYKGLAEATGLTELHLEFLEREQLWQICFAAPGAPMAASHVPERLRIVLGQNVKVEWDYPEHKISLIVPK